MSKFSNCLCTRARPNNNYLYNVASGALFYNIFNIPYALFNNNKNIIVPCIYCEGTTSPEQLENIYISATGVNLATGTIVTDGANKFISLGLCLYQKYIEE